LNLGLKGKVAIVAAASSGLGKATALMLASEGASMSINSRSSDRLNTTAREISTATGSEVLPVAGDLTVEADVNRLVAETATKFGRVDILVTNAGGPPAGFFDDFNADDYRRAVELNLISTVNLCREAVPLMRRQRWGRIVAIASIAAKQPVDNLILSNTARAGALGFLKSLSNQVAADGITVNTVCPGYHLTDRLKTLGASMADREQKPIEQIYAQWKASVPMDRIGDPNEFAAVVTFLCSQQASYITGTVIQVDGGAHKALF
jgi:3-oxoacyl-[acyl-carrier protein] reductase